MSPISFLKIKFECLAVELDTGLRGDRERELEEEERERGRQPIYCKGALTTPSRLQSLEQQSDLLGANQEHTKNYFNLIP